MSTSGGNVGQGQIFEFDPLNERMRLLFESPSADVLNAPDNLCVSPRGGIVLCEDGSGTEYVHGLTVDGTIFRFAQNNVDLRSHADQWLQPGLSRLRIRRGLLQPGRQVAVLQRAVPRHQLRGHRTVGQRRLVDDT